MVWGLDQIYILIDGCRLKINYLFYLVIMVLTTHEGTKLLLLVL